MDVLHLGKYFPPAIGGIESFLRDVVSYAPRGSRSGRRDVLCFGDTDSVIDLSRSVRVVTRAASVVAVTQPMSIGYLATYLQLQKRYDVVHVHVPNVVAVLCVLAARPRRLVVHWHGDITRRGPMGALARRLHDRLCRRADAIIATTQCYADSSPTLSQYLDQVVVIPYAFAEDRVYGDIDLTAAALKRLDYDPQVEQNVQLLTVGRHVAYKGIEVAIEALTYLPQGYTLRIVGTGPRTACYVRLAEELHVRQRVRFAGARHGEQLGREYLSSDLLLLPSLTRSESFGVVLLEAMATGMPLVTTAVPGSGMSEANVDAVTGRRVPPGDPAALAAAVRDVIEFRYASSSRACVRRYRDRYDLGSTVTEIERLYVGVREDISLSRFGLERNHSSV